MKHLLSILLISSICLTQEMQVDGDLKVTGSVESTTIDSLKAVIAQLQAQLAALQGAGILQTRVVTLDNIFLTPGSNNEDRYEINSMGTTLDFIYISNLETNNLKDNNTIILIENAILEEKFYHIFNDGIRLILPKRFRSGLLRIFSINKNGVFIRENHTILENGIPITTEYNSGSIYFSNIYHLVIDRFCDDNKENNVNNNDHSIDSRLKFHGGDFTGISRKINDRYEKRRLRKIADKLKPNGFGLIIRTGLSCFLARLIVDQVPDLKTSFSSAGVATIISTLLTISLFLAK